MSMLFVLFVFMCFYCSLLVKRHVSNIGVFVSMLCVLFVFIVHS